MDASEFMQRVGDVVKTTNERLLWNKMHDPVTKEAAQTWVLQFGQFTRHSRQCWANVVGNCPHIAVRRFIVAENLWEEEANEQTSHFDILVRMGEAVGLKADEILDATPVAATTAALLAWETLSRSRPWIEGLAAKGCLEMTNLAELGRWSGAEAERWMASLGLPREAVEFFTLHDEVDQVHSSGSMDAVVKYATPVDLDRALVAVEQSMAAWKVFFDGMALAAAEANER